MGMSRKKYQEEIVVREDVERFFEDVVGMENAKRSLQVFRDSQLMECERKDNGIGDEEEELITKTSNMAVIGERGSGKTMLADIITDFMIENGVRAEVEVIRKMARNIKKTDDVQEFGSYSERVIIIENIEDLILNDEIQQDTKKDICNMLEDMMLEHTNELTFIFTGSRSAFAQMCFLNRTIEDRFFDMIELQPYTTDELIQIMECLANNDRFHIHTESMPYLRQKLDAERKMSEFMNTINLERTIKAAKKNLVTRYKNHIEQLDELDEQSRFHALVTLIESDFKHEYGEKSLEDLWTELDALTGLAGVKAAVKDQVTMIQVGVKAAQAGVSFKNTHGTLHMAFVGEPGTGKTTVAAIVGKIYCALGVLPGTGHEIIHTVSRADLVSQYIGGTARLVKEACQKADGGVLFIDEAYSLVNSEQDSFGKEAVDTLIQEMENRRDTLMVILAGYEDEMNAFLKANPGFKSRVPNTIHFDNYSTDEMVQIFEYMIKDLGADEENGYILESEETKKVLRTFIETKSKAPDFGNARGVRNLLDRVIKNQRNRLRQEDEAGMEHIERDYRTISTEDIKATDCEMETDDKTIGELLAELKRLTGLEGVKKQVEDMVNAVRYDQIMKKEGLDQGRSVGTKHLIFSGNPGTGKSTVANLLGQIYVKLGVLKKNTFVLAKRADLVGEYQGQTAPKVANKVAEADGGILFIDEAYQLYSGERDSFGIEAIGTLLSLVEEKRDTLMVILAGYSENMEEFLGVNPGLRSRFPTVIEFTDYTMEELLDIFRRMCDKDSLHLEEGVPDLVREEIRKKKEQDSREFANARGVRNLLDHIVLKQRSRIVHEFDMGVVFSDPKEYVTIKKEDILGL